MLKRRLNELRIRLRIVPALPSPLLIKAPDGDETSTVEGRQSKPARFVRSGQQYYIPGSSLRGVLRTTAVHVVSRWQPEWAVASDPFTNHAQQWVDTRREQSIPTTPADIYRGAGPVDRCFGISAMKGHWSIIDAQPARNTTPMETTRPGLGIDRETGAVHSGLTFSFKPLITGVFETTLTLVNYELWQLGLLAHVLAQLDSGETRLGYGRRRGFGRVRIGIPSMSFRWYGNSPAVDADGLVAIPPLASLAHAAGISDDYGWHDGGLSLSLRLTKDPSVTIGSGWQLAPAAEEFIPALSLAPVDWSASPWPDAAALLRATLEKPWPGGEELVSANPVDRVERTG